MPAPRFVVGGRPALVAPTVWTTLRLTLHADGRTEAELAGGTPFPRHWVYGHDGSLVQKTATISFDEWYERRPGADRHAVGRRGLGRVRHDGGDGARARAVPHAHERRAAHDPGPAAGRGAVRQGDAVDGLFVLLDGMLSVDVDGRALGDLGPGAVVGERAALEDGTRTATLAAVTAVKVAVVDADVISEDALVDLTSGHRREEEL